MSRVLLLLLVLALAGCYQASGILDLVPDPDFGGDDDDSAGDDDDAADDDDSAGDDDDAADDDDASGDDDDGGSGCDDCSSSVAAGRSALGVLLLPLLMVRRRR